jgi:aerobic-type carbon monoxide dehydrogenase small subunit (CoxS/CutS family)
MNKIDVTLRVNGKEHPLNISPDTSLLKALREDLGLMGAREGCGIGLCGACTVLLNGRAINSCITLACAVEDAEIVTIEGLSDGEALHPVQQAFLDHAAFQCAYCTPGFILSTVALLKEYPQADDDIIRRYLNGNLCRCGSYANILNAVRVCAKG